ncbi:MAG: NUDIX domain-containing protein [Candidatus Diapherotrites archaeon]|nr:NUDIX domain-containing protein [Candidatus Diapherotrites archaeon]
MPHIHDQIDFTVEVFIVHKNKVLLRKHDKYKIWLSVGGHVELDEDPNQAALREVKEEVGLEVELYSGENFQNFENPKYRELIPPQFLNRNRINEKHEHVTLTYFAKSKTDKLELSEHEIIEECKWFAFEELEESKYGISDSIKFYAKTALEKLQF